MIHTIFCVNCGKRVSGDEKVYPAKLFFNLTTGVEETISPACSVECAREVVSNQIHMLEGYAESLKAQPQYVTTANEYMNPSKH